VDVNPKPAKDNSAKITFGAIIIAFIALLGFLITRDNARQQEKERQEAYDRQGDEQLRQMRENFAKYQRQTDAERQADFDREQQDNQR
jgi:hypothetical protein